MIKDLWDKNFYGLLSLFKLFVLVCICTHLAQCGFFFLLMGKIYFFCILLEFFGLSVFIVYRIFINGERLFTVQKPKIVDYSSISGLAAFMIKTPAYLIFYMLIKIVFDPKTINWRGLFSSSRVSRLPHLIVSLVILQVPYRLYRLISSILVGGWSIKNYREYIFRLNGFVGGLNIVYIHSGFQTNAGSGLNKIVTKRNKKSIVEAYRVLNKTRMGDLLAKSYRHKLGVYEKYKVSNVPKLKLIGKGETPNEPVAHYFCKSQMKLHYYLKNADISRKLSLRLKFTSNAKNAMRLDSRLLAYTASINKFILPGAKCPGIVCYEENSVVESYKSVPEYKAYLSEYESLELLNIQHIASRKILSGDATVLGYEFMDERSEEIMSKIIEFDSELVSRFSNKLAEDLSVLDSEYGCDLAGAYWYRNYSNFLERLSREAVSLEDINDVMDTWDFLDAGALV